MFLLFQKEDVEDLINSQKAAIQIYAFFAIGMFLFGISLLVFANLFIRNIEDSTIKLIITIGGAFVSSLSTFPIKEIINRNDKIGTYQVLKRHVIFISEKGDQIPDKEKEKILDLIMAIIRQSALIGLKEGSG